MWRKEQTETLLILAEVYLDQGQPERAAILLEALHWLEPDSVPVLRALSYALLQAGRTEEALAALDALLRRDAAMPAQAPALLMRSKALWALGRAAEAQESWQRYLQLGAPA